MNEKKVLSRKLFISFEMTCIILVVCLVGLVSLFSWQMNEKNNTIADKNSQVDALNAQVVSLQTQVNNLTNLANELNGTVSNLSSILSLGKSSHWFLAPDEIDVDPNSYEEWSANAGLWQVYYAGYVWIHLDSNNTNTYVELIWGNYGIHYDNQIVVGTNGTAVFPILPLEPVYTVSIKVGNTDTSNAAHVFVTATYYY
jgi:hypothetical protein